jgi:hypothetical protein
MLICWRVLFLKCLIIGMLFLETSFVCILVLSNATLKTEVRYSSRSFVSTSKITSCHKPHNHKVNTYRHGNLKTSIVIVLADDKVTN